jgi:hypothetical protein
MKMLITAAISLLGFNAFAGYSRLAECTGYTDKNLNAYATLFVNKTKDTEGIIVVNVDGAGVRISDTKVDWNANQNGYPKFYDNDYDLDIVINDKSASVDDILVGEDYISQLSCVYKP